MSNTLAIHSAAPVKHYVLRVDSNGFANGVVPIDDVIETGCFLPYPYFPNEPENIFPRRIIALIIEGYCHD